MGHRGAFIAADVFSAVGSYLLWHKELRRGLGSKRGRSPAGASVSHYPDSMDWMEVARRHVWRPYTQEKNAAPPVAIEKTDGVRLFLRDGRVLVDGLSSWWTACHGYNHPHIRAALTEQLAKMPHVMLGGLMHEPVARLAQRLATLLPGDLSRVFFTDSGSVAVEVGLKIAVQSWLNRGIRGKHKFLSFQGGYHGDTFACMSVCDPEEGMHGLFRGTLAEQRVVALPNSEDEFAAFEACLERDHQTLAGVILEPLLQGAGGMRVHTPAQLAKIAALTHKYDLLLILDEVATGFGRTGTLFACEQARVVPDIICLSKALTGGTLPLAATVATERVYADFVDDNPMHALMHGPTFMGNALACVAANASLDLFEREPRLEQVAAIEQQLKAELEACRALKGVRDVRVKGAMGAVELDSARDLEWMRARFVEEGVWVRPLPKVVYLTPPFVTSEEDLATLCRAVCRVVAAWAERKAA